MARSHTPARWLWIAAFAAPHGLLPLAARAQRGGSGRAAAQVQTLPQIDVHLPAQLVIGHSAPVEVTLRSPGVAATGVRGARLSATCGSFEGDSIYVAPGAIGSCTITAVVSLAGGGSATGNAAVEIVRVPLAARVGARAKPPAAVAPPKPIILSGPAPTPVSQPEYARAAHEPLPQFPWPVPAATTHMTIPRVLVADSIPVDSMGDRLGGVADKIEAAVHAAGLDFAVYAVGDSGFAYVTKVEMIHPDGSPYPPPDRFPDDVHLANPGGGFLSFITSRFFARPGYFRVIAIVVTDRALEVASSKLAVDSATALANGGMSTLPPLMRDVVVANLQFVAYVYEYERASAADTVVTFRTGATAPAQTHLALAGLWSLTQLQPAP